MKASGYNRYCRKGLGSSWHKRWHLAPGAFVSRVDLQFGLYSRHRSKPTPSAQNLFLRSDKTIASVTLFVTMFQIDDSRSFDLPLQVDLKGHCKRKTCGLSAHGLTFLSFRVKLQYDTDSINTTGSLAHLAIV